MERKLTCIICPRGCDMTLYLDDGKLISVEGNACPRGKSYAEDECTHPKRSVTSTVRTESGRLQPVKTSAAIPKELVFACMDEINSVVAPDGLSIGDAVISDVLGTGVDVVVTGKAI